MAMPSFSPRYEQAKLLQEEIHPRDSHLIKEDKVLKMSDMALRLFTTPPAVQYHYQAKTLRIPLLRPNFMVFQPRLFSSTKSSVRSGTIRCKATGESSQSSFNPTVYQGIYGPWTVDSSDVREVILYRSGLVTAAASFVLAASVTFLPDNFSWNSIIKQNVDLFYSLGAGGLGLSLLLIHIYVTEIKRTLQALWAVGIVGSLATYITLAQPAGESLVQYVVDNPTVVWFIGPLFAALTGLVFKEGLCYGKLEATVLTFIIPILLLGHLTSLMEDGAKVTLLGLWMALFVVFAARKFTQPIKDDIGDKSVFMFNALPEKEKKALVKKLEQQKQSENLN